MKKEELIKQLQEHEPLLANAVSHMVEYIQETVTLRHIQARHRPKL